MMITHDRYFLDNVTGWILELDRGRSIPYEGNYSAYLEAKAKRMQQEGREDAGRQKARSREQEWIQSSPEGPPGQVQGAYQGIRTAARTANNSRPATPRSSFRSPNVSARW
jgi:ATPase subunit of ABC transporter with duplicated ATPase domains